MQVVLIALNRFLQEKHGSKMAFMDGVLAPAYQAGICTLVACTASHLVLIISNQCQLLLAASPHDDRGLHTHAC